MELKGPGAPSKVNETVPMFAGIHGNVSEHKWSDMRIRSVSAARVLAKGRRVA